MKYLIIVLFTAGYLLSACNNKSSKSEHDHSDHHEDHTYSCPMHPEITGHEGDECSKCGMKLEPSKDAVDAKTYKMQFGSNPEIVEANKLSLLSFIPKIVGHENDQVPLAIEHEKKIHLIMVSEDLSWFDHQHPEYQASGNYDLPYTFTKGGNYLLFADYKPSGGGHQLEKISVNVKGDPLKIVKFSESKLVSNVDGFTVNFVNGNELKSGIEGHILISIEKNGKVINPNILEKYLGSNAHIVMIGNEFKDYLHVHPEADDFPIHAHTMVSKPGLYRMWMQFQTEGKVHTADFVINVSQGTPDEKSKSHHDHH